MSLSLPGRDEKGCTGYEDIISSIERAVELMRSEGAVR
jgi:hypothetical protein